MLSRWARLEDWYGSAAPDAYARLVQTLSRENAPKQEIIEICHRGLQVSLREERFDAARRFAEESAHRGDPSDLELLKDKKFVARDSVKLLGGVAALHFLAIGKGKPDVDRFFLDYSRVLSSVYGNTDRSDLRNLARTVHEYFQQLTSLAALGSHNDGHIEIVLTLNDKAGAERTETALAILGLKLTRNDAGLSIESVEGKSQAQRRDMQAALGINDRLIQQVLSSDGAYRLEIPVDYVPVYPAEHIWFASVKNQPDAGGLAELFVRDLSLPRLYLALNSMDRGAAEALLNAIPLPALAQRYSRPLSLFSASIALNNGRAEVPGGSGADSVWQQLVGVSPTNPAAFFQSLLARDEGRLISFFNALSNLDLARQRFFTRSFERLERFYELFRDSPEMRYAGGQRVYSSSLLDFLRELPAEDTGNVVFPGSADVWLLAKGKSQIAAAKLGQQPRPTTVSGNADAVLIRLATTEYRIGTLQKSELANFIAVTRINHRRTKGLTPESALLLAQCYPRFGALYPYFSVLANLEASDFQSAFTLAAKLDGLRFATANVRLGEFHSYLAMLCLIEQNGLGSANEIRELYRRGIRRYSQARDAAAWTSASLAAIDDLAQLAHGVRRDEAIRMLLLNTVAAKNDTLEQTSADYKVHREKAYRQILSLQKVPSLDALFTIRDSLAKMLNDPGALEFAQKEIRTLVTITPAYRESMELQKQSCLEQYQAGPLESTLARLRYKIAQGNRNPADFEKLSTRVLAELEPWVELAMAGQIYARYLDPSDLVVSADPMLLRKHLFAGLERFPGAKTPLLSADFKAFSSGEGSYFTGGFAEFNFAAGQARAEGNHLGSPWGEAVAGAVFASVRATDWRPLTESGLQTFGANVRLAREWIVESATSDLMRQQLEEKSMGLLSLSRRSVLLGGILRRDWKAVWESIGVGDLYFLGRLLVEQAPASLWRTPALIAMKRVATQPEPLDLLGQVAPDLSGSAVPRLQRYQPFEEYERYSVSRPVAQRVAELKLYLAWLADSSATPPRALEAAAPLAADAVSKTISMLDPWDWNAVLEGFRSLQPQMLRSLSNLQ